MLKLLVGLSLKHRHAVLVLAALLTGYGLYIASNAKLDVFPEFAPPLVVIHTEAPGLSPEEVEALVTRPVENGLNGVGGLQSIRSQSIQGLSVVTAIFEDGTDVFKARQMVSERLVEIAGRLPAGIQPPVLDPLTSSTSLVLTLGLTSRRRSLMEVRTFADWTLRPRLLGVPGVAKVVEFGGEVRRLEAQIRPDRLLAHHVSLEEAIQAARQATGIRGAGFIETENQRLPIRSEGQAIVPADLAEAVVAHRQGASIRLEDVARVAEAPKPKIGDAAVNGQAGILLLVWSHYGSNTMEVTRAVEAALEELRQTMEAEGIDLQPRLFRPASFIETSIGNVNRSMLLGGLLVAAVLSLFLFNLRTAFISLTAIPLSILTAVIVLDALGATLNTLTLGGFAIAIGEVVDDAIIDVENIFRRLRENMARGSPRSLLSVVFDASLEVRSAVVYATFVVALVFLPVLTLSGVQGKLFAPLGLAYILATLASLAVALAVTPALSMVLLARPRESREPVYLGWLKDLHALWLRGLSARPRLTISGALLLCLGAAAVLPFFGGEFLPEFQEGYLILHMQAVAGTSARESMRLGGEVTRALLALPRIQSVGLQVGRAELGEDTAGTDFSELVVALEPPYTQEAGEEIRQDLRRTLAAFPGARFAVKSFLEERIEETISGTTAEVVIRIYGDDLDALDQKAEEVEQLLKKIPGSADVQFHRSVAPQMVVRLNRERLKQFGFRALEVLEALHAAYQGAEVAQIYDRNQVVDVAVILEEAARRDPESLARLLLGNDRGQLVPLAELAEVFSGTGRHLIQHDGTRRYQEIACNVVGRDLASFIAAVKAKLAQGVKFPAGVYPVFAGAAELQSQARREILVHGAAAGIGILILLGIVFRRLANLLLVLSNLPFALAGGVLAVLCTGGNLSVGSLVGFVTLFGITTRNSIMLVSHYEHLVAVEGKSWGLETALHGARERLVPILMTALVTALGLLPIAAGAGEAGREIEGPMARVILGGLATSTLLNLFVLPSLAWKFGRFTGFSEEALEA